MTNGIDLHSDTTIGGIRSRQEQTKIGRYPCVDDGMIWSYSVGMWDWDTIWYWILPMLSL